jgi:hypothetical protein
MNSLLGIRDQLLKDINRWLKQAEMPDVAATYLEGSSGKAVNSLDELLRRYLRIYMKECGVQWTDEIAKVANGKPIDSITLGEVIAVFRHLDSTFTACLRARGLSLDRQVFAPAEKLLADVNELRKLLVHHRSQFASSYEVLRSNTKNLLLRIESALGDALFRTLADGPAV